MICLYLSWWSLCWFIFLAFQHRYLRFAKYTIISSYSGYIILRNRNLLLKMWVRLLFSALFPFLSSGCAVYICLVGGDVILDESWAGSDIDSRVIKVHTPVFCAPCLFWTQILLIFTKTPLERIMRVGHFVSVRGSSSLMSSGRCIFFSSLNEDNNLVSDFMMRI